MENLDPLCTFDCDNYEFNSVEATVPSDRRYWLLTVVGGLFGPADYPLFEEKLAKLYRIAFTRQQAKHLGLANGAHNVTNNTLTTTTMERIKREITSHQVPIMIAPTKVLPSPVPLPPPTPPQSVPLQIHLNQHVLDYERGLFLRRQRKRIRQKRDLEVANTISTNTSSLTFDGNGEQPSPSSPKRSNYQQILVERRQNRRKVTVKIHNVTQLTEDEAKRLNEQETFQPKR